MTQICAAIMKKLVILAIFIICSILIAYRHNFFVEPLNFLTISCRS